MSAKQILRKIYTSVTRYIPDHLYLPMMYRRDFGDKLHLDAPVLFSEKMQWLKIHNRKPEFTAMVDKHDAKEFVARAIGTQYIISTLGCWEKFDDIDFDALPRQFVLKCTHDSGGLVICQDKEKLDLAEARRKIETCMQNNWYYMRREWPYKNVKPRIIAEEYLENDSHEGLHDYKVWCFNGEPEYVQYISGRLGTTYEGFYDRDWQLQDFTYHNPKLSGDVPRPVRLDEMLDLCRKLAAGGVHLFA